MKHWLVLVLIYLDTAHSPEFLNTKSFLLLLRFIREQLKLAVEAETECTDELLSSRNEMKRLLVMEEVLSIIC